MKTLLTLCFLLFLSKAYAQDKPVFKQDTSYWLIGVHGGGAHVKSDVGDEEDSKSGLRAGANLNFSHYTKNWVWDGGIGWAHLRFETEIIDDLQVKLTTNTAFIDFNPRFRLTNRISIGPALTYILGEEMLFGATDSVRNIESEATTDLLAGVSAFYALPWKNRLARIAARVERPLNIGERSGLIFYLGAQIGWPFGKKKAPAPAPQPEQPLDDYDDYDGPEAEPEEPEEPEEPANTVNLETQFVIFEHNSAALTKRSTIFLKNIALFLKKFQTSWTNIKINGHTDNVGPDLYNEDLSYRRAQSVRRVFVANGVDQSRISSDGLGERFPLTSNDTAAGRSQNRRVELEFVGDVDSQKIQAFIDKVLRVMREKQI